MTIIMNYTHLSRSATSVHGVSLWIAKGSIWNYSNDEGGREESPNDMCPTPPRWMRRSGNSREVDITERTKRELPAGRGFTSMSLSSYKGHLAQARAPEGGRGG